MKKNYFFKIIVVTLISSNYLVASSGTNNGSDGPKFTSLPPASGSNVKKNKKSKNDQIVQASNGNSELVCAADKMSGSNCKSELISCNGSDGKLTIKLNNKNVSGVEAARIFWISKNVIPHVTDVNGDDKIDINKKLDIAAKTTWWSLREGVLGAEPHYSLCEGKNKDISKTSDLLYTCKRGKAWQVGGLAASQVHHSGHSKKSPFSDDNLANIANKVYGDNGYTKALAAALQLAGFDENSTEYKNVINSSNKDVKKSWLLRNPLIAFPTVAYHEVEVECFKQKKSWCKKGSRPGTPGSYPNAIKFGNGYATMSKIVNELKSVYSCLQGMNSQQPHILVKDQQLPAVEGAVDSSDGLSPDYDGPINK